MHHLTHGVCVVLCEEHRSDGFQCLREGHVFVGELAGMWRAAGIFATRHRSALATHLRRILARSEVDAGAPWVLLVAVASCRGGATVCRR